MTQGQVVAVFHTPTAFDATGQSVPTSLSTAGNQVTMTVSHLGGGYTYPILADPTATDARAANRGAQGIGINLGEFFQRQSETGVGKGPLRIRFAKRLIKWQYSDSQRADVANWITQLHQHDPGSTAILSLAFCKQPDALGCPFKPANLNDYEANFRLWKQAFPGVKYWVSWNEPNNPGDPYLRDPATPAHQWQIAQRDCGSACTVVAGEFNGSGFNLQRSYVRGYTKAILDRNHYKRLPTIWGIHDYTDLIHFKPKSTHPNGSLRMFAQFLRDAAPNSKTGPGGNLGGRLRIFVLEAGAATQLGYRPYLRNPTAQAAAAKDFFALPAVDRGVSPMVDKIAYYTYLSDPYSEPFVSGLLNSQPKDTGDPFCPAGISPPPGPGQPGTAFDRRNAAYSQIAGTPDKSCDGVTPTP